MAAVEDKVLRACATWAIITVATVNDSFCWLPQAFEKLLDGGVLNRAKLAGTLSDRELSATSSTGPIPPSVTNRWVHWQPFKGF